MLVRSVAGQLLVPVLAALLVLTTPIGTGQGVHADELLHPVLPHVHLVGGRFVTDAQMAAAQTAASTQESPSAPISGPAFGTGNGPDAAGLGLAVGPTLPNVGLSTALVPEGRLVILRGALPDEFRDSPQDPPPNRIA